MSKKILADLKIIIITFIILLFIKICLVYLWPFVISLFIVFLIEPIVNFFVNKNIKRNISVIISITISSLCIILILIYISKYAYVQLTTFIEKLPDIISMFTKNIKYLNNKNINYDNVMNSINNFIYSYKEKIFNFIMTTSKNLVYIIIILINTVFISMDLDKISMLIKKFLTEKTTYILSNVTIRITKMIDIEFKLVSFSTILTTAGFYILGFEHSLTIGIICGILDILPVVGPSLIFIPMIIYELLVKNIFLFFGLILLFILLQITRQLLEIKFVGNNLKLHPVITLLSLYIGVLIYGVWGIFLGPIITILIKEIIEDTMERRINFKI